MPHKISSKNEDIEDVDIENIDMRSRFAKIQNEIIEAALKCGRNPEEIILVAVSKKKSVETVINAVNAGVTIFGENYIQEAVEKIEAVNKITTDKQISSIKNDKNYNGKIDQNYNSKIDEYRDKSPVWHFIGHLQSNKAKTAVKYFDLIHSVDSIKSAEEINKNARQIGKIQNILIQINISEENTKSGTDAENAVQLAKEISNLKYVSLKGIMGMPPFFDDPEGARPYFKELAKIRDSIKEMIIKKSIVGISMEHLSMGMSGDFKVAIEEGSTMVRIGTSIFGSR